MARYIWPLTFLCLIVGAILLVTQKNTVTRLEERLREVTQQNRVLDQAMSELREQQRADRALIGQLWPMAQARETAGDTPAAQPPSSAGFDELAVRKLIESSGGNLDAVLKAILTPERLQAILQNHPENPAYRAAVASFLGDPDQVLSRLEEAAAQHPGSSMVRALLVNEQMARGRFDERTLESIHNLRTLDPNNALADHYEAYWRFQQGDTEGAVQALAAASDKDRFADHRLDLLMARYHCLLESGCSDGMALGLSAFTLPLSHLGMFREVGAEAIGQVETLLASGNSEQALRIAEYLLRVGRNLSASGRFLAYDQVGIGLQQAALNTMQGIYESASNDAQVQEIVYQLDAIRSRSAQIADMAERFGAVLGTMSEADVSRYIDATILNGEYSTLQTILK